MIKIKTIYFVCSLTLIFFYLFIYLYILLSKLLLILAPSINLYPLLLVFAALSEPAKSTNVNFELRVSCETP